MEKDVILYIEDIDEKFSKNPPQRFTIGKHSESKIVNLSSALVGGLSGEQVFSISIEEMEKFIEDIKKENCHSISFHRCSDIEGNGLNIYGHASEPQSDAIYRYNTEKLKHHMIDGFIKEREVKQRIEYEKLKAKFEK